MQAFRYISDKRSFVRSTVLLLTLACVSYVAGALSHNTGSSRDASAAFAPPVQAASFNFRDTLAASAAIAPPTADAWDRIPDPRECDLGRGIATTCQFMD
jgi:hypothetical protein